MKRHTVAARLLADLPGVPVNADDPRLLERWVGGRSLDAIADAVIADQPDRLALLRLVLTGDYSLLVCSSAHPCLAQLAEWAEREPDIVLAASSSGPPPPAVLIFTEPRVAG